MERLPTIDDGGFPVTSDRRILLAGAALLLAGSASQAFAQSTVKQAGGGAENFARDRNIAVSDRNHQGYEARGLRMGGFQAFPKVSLTGEVNDNIYAQKTNETNDVVWRVRPEVVVASDWSRHSLQVYANATANRYQDNSSENTTDYNGGVNVRLDASRNAHLDLGGSGSRTTEPRTSPNAPTAALEPTRFDTTTFYVGGSNAFNRLRLSTRFDYAKNDYDDSSRPGVGPASIIDQDFRDRTNTSIMGRADYAVSPDTALFVEVVGNKRDYRRDKPAVALTRDSEGVQALVGANFELGALTRGEVGVGYMRQSYEDASVNDVTGFGARAQVEWFPSQLTTVTFAGSRTVEDSVLVTTPAYISSNISAKVDHEFLRNILVAGQIGYGKDDYEKIDRGDKRLSAGINATYLLNHNAGLNVGYSYSKQTSDGLANGPEFKVNKLSATLTLQF